MQDKENQQVTLYGDRVMKDYLDLDPDFLSLPLLLSPQREFQVRFGQGVADSPQDIHLEKVSFRYQLMQEELLEYLQAATRKDTEKTLDALGDLLVTIFGTIHEHGMQNVIGPAYLEIMRTNLNKLQVDGSYKDDENGKTMKPEGWLPPNLEKFIK